MSVRLAACAEILTWEIQAGSILDDLQIDRFCVLRIHSFGASAPKLWIQPQNGGVKPEEAIERLRTLLDEAARLPHSTGSAEFNSWQPRVRSVLTRALGESHHITERFVTAEWTPSRRLRANTRAAFEDAFNTNIPKAQLGVSWWKQLSWPGGRRRLLLGFGSSGYGVAGC
jgi:hypothetical protein